METLRKFQSVPHRFYTFLDRFMPSYFIFFLGNIYGICSLILLIGYCLHVWRIDIFMLITMLLFVVFSKHISWNQASFTSCFPSILMLLFDFSCLIAWLLPWVNFKEVVGRMDFHAYCSWFSWKCLWFYPIK